MNKQKIIFNELSIRFPNIKSIKDRSGRIFYYTNEALSLCNKFEAIPTSLSPDAGYIVRPYVNIVIPYEDIKDQRVYGWEPFKEFGEGDLFSFCLYNKWEDRIVRGLKKELEDRIKLHLKAKELEKYLDPDGHL